MREKKREREKVVETRARLSKQIEKSIISSGKVVQNRKIVLEFMKYIHELYRKSKLRIVQRSCHVVEMKSGVKNVSFHNEVFFESEN